MFQDPLIFVLNQPNYHRHYTVYLEMNVRGKAITLQAFTGPEGSRRLRLPDFKTIGT
jgi:hypothetical protein